MFIVSHIEAIHVVYHSYPTFRGKGAATQVLLLFPNSGASWAFLNQLSPEAIQSHQQVSQSKVVQTPELYDKNILEQATLSKYKIEFKDSSHRIIAFTLHPVEVDCGVRVSGLLNLLLTYFTTPAILNIKYPLPEAPEIFRRTAVSMGYCNVLNYSLINFNEFDAYTRVKAQLDRMYGGALNIVFMPNRTGGFNFILACQTNAELKQFKAIATQWARDNNVDHTFAFHLVKRSDNPSKATNCLLKMNEGYPLIELLDKLNSALEVGHHAAPQPA